MVTARSNSANGWKFVFEDLVLVMLCGVDGCQPCMVCECLPALYGVRVFASLVWCASVCQPCMVCECLPALYGVRVFASMGI